MRGKIEINAESTGVVDVDIGMEDVSMLDVLVLFDSLAQSLDLDAEEREFVGAVFCAGGLGAMPGVTMAKVGIPKGIAELIREMKEKQTDDN